MLRHYYTIPIRGVLLLLLLCSLPALHSQQVAVKTNGLMLAAMMPNVGCEFVVGERSSIDLSAFGSINIYGNKAKMIGFQPEYRYWFNGRPMTREFIGVARSRRILRHHLGTPHLSRRRSRSRYIQPEQTSQHRMLRRLRSCLFQTKTILRQR